MIRITKTGCLIAASLAVLHTLSTLFDPTYIGSNIMLALGPVLAAFCCFWRAYQRGAVREKWVLFGGAMAIWAFGQADYTYEVIIQRHAVVGAVPADFWFLLYGIFLLITLCSVGQGQDSTAILIADGAQAALATVLIYVMLFESTAQAGRHALAPTALSWLYFAENLAIAVVATLRLLAVSQGEDRFFHRLACVYSWVMLAACTALIYINDFVAPTDGKLIEIFWVAPFLLVIVTALSTGAKQDTQESNLQTWGAMTLSNVSPFFFTLCVLLLAAHLAQTWPHSGFAAVMASLLIYAFRVTLSLTRLRELQIKLTHSEESLRNVNERLHEQTRLDPLLGIANRRHFDSALREEWNRALRAGQSVAILMMDIDHFKRLNDRYGHPYGDQCLKTVAGRLGQDIRRAGEILARYGGEEFVALLPGRDLSSAFRTGEALRMAIEQLHLENLDSPLEHLTMSVGISATLPVPESSPELLLKEADAALYRAKVEGRNRCQAGAMPVSIRQTDVRAALDPGKSLANC